MEFCPAIYRCIAVVYHGLILAIGSKMCLLGLGVKGLTEEFLQVCNVKILILILEAKKLGGAVTYLN